MFATAAILGRRPGTTGRSNERNKEKVETEMGAAVPLEGWSFRCSATEWVSPPEIASCRTNEYLVSPFLSLGEFAALIFTNVPFKTCLADASRGEAADCEGVLGGWL